MSGGATRLQQCRVCKKYRIRKDETVTFSPWMDSGVPIPQEFRSDTVEVVHCTECAGRGVPPGTLIIDDGGGITPRSTLIVRASIKHPSL